MKITVIAPIALKRKSTYESKPCCEALPCDFEFVFIDEGPMLVLNAYDQAYATFGVVKKAQEAQNAIAALQRVFRFGNPNTIIKKAVALLGLSGGGLP